jgi:hypothetical protein
MRCPTKPGCGPAGFRGDKDVNGAIKVDLNKPWAAGRRFALARLVGDHLYAHAADRVLPATDAGTARQKFQRAFAQAMLYPFDTLRERLIIPMWLHCGFAPRCSIEGCFSASLLPTDAH